MIIIFFFFNDTATTEIYTLSLHDALPISNVVILTLVLLLSLVPAGRVGAAYEQIVVKDGGVLTDRKSTRLNSSHVRISYAVFCLKKKKKMRADLLRA